MSTMTTTTSSSSPFTQAVVASMRRLYPEALADKSFDNTGLLVEAPVIPSRPRNKNSVLLTIDLTRAVADEAITGQHSVVVSYHPIIFRGLKSITSNDTQQTSIALLLAHGISVYCPHTAVDTVPGGMADWLCDIVTGKVDAPEPEAYTAGVTPSPQSDTDVTTSASEPEVEAVRTDDTKPVSSSDQHSDSTSDPSATPQAKKPRLDRPALAHRKYSKPTYPMPTPSFHAAVLPHTRAIVTPSAREALDAANRFTERDDDDNYNVSNTGAGRLITFNAPQPLTLLITRIAHAIGLPKGFSVAIPQAVFLEDVAIKTVATCPGSGGGVLRNARADLIFTGELSHHEALAVTERGGCVISLFHSNSERGYLSSVMRDELREELGREWSKVRDEGVDRFARADGVDKEIAAILKDESFEVVVSEKDRDPYGIVVLDEATVEGVKIDKA